jgi:hypothetical protein
MKHSQTEKQNAVQSAKYQYQAFWLHSSHDV